MYVQSDTGMPVSGGHILVPSMRGLDEVMPVSETVGSISNELPTFWPPTTPLTLVETEPTKEVAG